MRLGPLLLLAACRSGDDAERPPGSDAPLTGAGVFAEGCPADGEALARPIGVDARLAGDVAVGAQGDFLLANGSAAYVITRPDAGSTYYYYGGIVADAAPMAGCEQAADDRLDEVGLVLGQLDFVDFERSILRDFRADTVEVIGDGSDGGAAIVRATGTDDMHWLVEYELISAKADDGGRPLTQPFGLAITVDYRLEPDSPVLHLDWTVANPTETERSLLTGALLSFAPSLELASAGAASASFAGIDLVSAIPYLSATDGESALAYGLDHGNLAYTRIAGIDVALNFDQALASPLDLPPGGSATTGAVLSVGAGSGATATGPLVAAAPSRLPAGGSATMALESGSVVDEAGAPIPGARVELWGDGGAGFAVLDLAWTDDAGRYTHAVPAFSPEPWAFELAASAPGRDPGPRVAVGAALVLGPEGALDLRIEEGGAPVPARIALVRADGARRDLWTTGTSQEPVAPGAWDYTVTRGFEYLPDRGTLVVPPGGSVELAATMARVVDTTGWVSLDTHVHTAFSPDSRMEASAQVLHAAAHGLDVVLHTEHEVIVDERDNPVLAGVSGFVKSVTGLEMTATIPEHMTMFPVLPDGSPRGGPINWYGLDIAELFAAMHERTGDGINILNHPGYLDLVAWDYVTAEPGLDDPTLLGLPADAALWSWELEGIEVMNGHGSPFANGNARFEKWQSLLNAGHPVFPAGCSDDHGGDEVGFPLTYVASDADSPSEIDEAALVVALRAGRASVSDGAFADVAVGGAGPGDLVAAVDGAVQLDVEIRGIPDIDVTHVVVFANCDEVAQLEATDPGGIVKLSTAVDLAVTGDTTLVVAAFGAELLPLGLPQFDPATTPRALTGAIYVDANGNGAFDAPGGRICAYDVSR